MTTPPGFFAFRWRPSSPSSGPEDIALVFKVPGAVDLSVLPDLFEEVCRGPLIPDAVVLIHLVSDDAFVGALGNSPAQAAMLRFDGRLPLARVELNPKSFGLALAPLRGCPGGRWITQLQAILADQNEAWIQAGLASIFEPGRVIVSAPAGYAFRKPSNSRSRYFIRADQGLLTSAAVSFVALSILQRLVVANQGVPSRLKLIYVDTMSVASTAFALRELLSHAGVSVLPQMESFHSYGGIESVIEPFPGTSLCIISASSSMNLHRQWVKTKRVYDRDVLTLLTFDDAIGKEHALHALPADSRPSDSDLTARYDIRISGENFFPVTEPPRKVLLTTTHHSCPAITSTYLDLYGKDVFDIFRASTASSRRGLFVDDGALIGTNMFRAWFDWQVPQSLKAGTTQVIYQDAGASLVLARHVAQILVTLGGAAPQILSVDEVAAGEVDSAGALVAVAAVVGRGNRLLSLSRELRNVHRGPRLYVIGFQVAPSEASIAVFEKNIRHSSSGSKIDVLRMRTCLLSDAIEESLDQELEMIYGQHVDDVPPELTARAAALRQGFDRPRIAVLLPTGQNLDVALSLNEGFAFWPHQYTAGPYQAEALATVGGVLQNARTATLRQPEQQLRSPMLVQVTLDPDNFSRFNDPILQACILRSALASELDYRGDVDSSCYMRTFFERMASRVGQEHQAELEFLTALAIGRLRLTAGDTVAVREAFHGACSGPMTPLRRSVQFLLRFLDRSGKASGDAAF